MYASHTLRRRSFLVLAIAGAALVLGAATAAGQSDPSPQPTPGIGSGWASSTGVAVPGVSTVAAGVAPSGIEAPAWCCGASGDTLGITTVGQASADGQDVASRNAAIAKAVQDATDQAKVAADAAGIALGPAVDLQVSSAPFAYPMLGSAGSSPGSPGGSATEPMPYQSFVSVTVTWSIG